MQADTVYYDFGSGEQRFILNNPHDVVRISSTPNAAANGKISDGMITQPLSVSEGNITVVSLYSNENVLFYALTNIFRKMFAFSNTFGHAFYVKIDYVYPVSDYALVTQMAEYMRDNGIPFCFVVMPIYEEEAVSLPEMDDFIKFLIHLRECGGTPIIHCPVINQVEPNPEDMSYKLTRALEVYTQRGIYPVGIEAPEMLLYKNGFDSFFDNFSTYFYEKDLGKDVWKLISPTSMPSFDGHGVSVPSFQMAVGETTQIDDTNVDTTQHELNDALMDAVKSGQPYTVSIPSWLSFESFKGTIDVIKRMNVMVASMKSMNHSMSFAAHKLEYTSDWIVLDGKPVENLLYSPHALPKQQQEQPKPASPLDPWNAFITAIAGAAILFFMFALLWARRINLRKFFRR